MSLNNTIIKIFPFSSVLREEGVSMQRIQPRVSGGSKPPPQGSNATGLRSQKGQSNMIQTRSRHFVRMFWNIQVEVVSVPYTETPSLPLKAHLGSDREPTGPRGGGGDTGKPTAGSEQAWGCALGHQHHWECKHPQNSPVNPPDLLPLAYVNIGVKGDP